MIESQLIKSNFFSRPPSDNDSMPHPINDDFLPEHRPPPRAHDAHYALLTKNEELLVGKYLNGLSYIKLPIEVNGELVGIFVVSKRSRLLEDYEFALLEQQTNYLWIIATATILLTLLTSFLLSRHLVEPVKKIAKGMYQLTRGNYLTKLELDRKDELGQLSKDFNTLALTLEKNEHARKRWLANISHELRTPMSILLGELEAMLLGIREKNTENIRSANEEALHLKRLIDDLHLLNSTELGGMDYTMKPMDFIQFLTSIERKYQVLFKHNNIRFDFINRAESVSMEADNTRLLQLIDNVLMNSMRYAKCSIISLSVCNVSLLGKTYVELTIADNGIGVSTEHLPHLFEYLYRVDHSRNRLKGGTGLGLSICQHIVMAHKGQMVAESSRLGGLAIVIRFPVL